MANRQARERIAAIRAQSEMGGGRSDGHISYNSFLMNFIADLNEKEERGIVAGYKRIRNAAKHAVPIRSRNVLTAEGEPTPRAQRILAYKSSIAKRERNPLGYGNLEVGPTPRPNDAEHKNMTLPADSLRRLEAQFSTGRRSNGSGGGGSGDGTARSGSGSGTARSTRSNGSGKGTARYSSPRWSDVSSLSSGFNSYRSMDSNMTDISIGDIDALGAQRLRLEQRINMLNSKMAMRATTSPKMGLFGNKNKKKETQQLSSLSVRSGAKLPGVVGEREEDEGQRGSPGSGRLSSGRKSARSQSSSTGRRIVHLGETGNPELKTTSRSVTTKLMRTLADAMNEV